jgi:hypothetical protein
MRPRIWSLFVLALWLGGCFRHRPDGAASPPIAARPPLSLAEASASWAGAKQVLERRCVVCHGCYDAPCQLKLDSYAGIARGGTEQKVYDGNRLLAIEPTRLDIDAHDVAGWRQRGFHPVLPEGRADPDASLLTRMLELKRKHPLPETPDLGKDFTFGLDRKQTCADERHFEAYAEAHPLWGMPYGLPALADGERAALGEWLDDGAPYPEPPPLSPALNRSVAAWESFLNAPALKSRLMARYVYEHLFLASVYFEAADETLFFRLVRSRTPPGSLVDEIATRRPFDDPGTSHLYYRLVRRSGPALSKTHMAYLLDARRMELYRTLFLAPDYVVDRLPTYEPEVGANPFRAFAAIPVRSRYRFMLSEAEFTIMGFIKGPVCRGQVALDVIQDRFWVTFLDPDVPWMADEDAFLASAQPDLDMPAESGSSSWAVLWNRYGQEHDSYMKKRGDFLAARAPGGHGVDLASIWDGDGHNANAALTVFRHFDSATVVQGLVGGPPKTAWVVDYPLLERVHYLLVAGFDVFGNVGHQLSTRLYMDFLRMEGESNLMLLLPKERRPALVASWYRGVTGAAHERVNAALLGFTGEPRITYRTTAQELELFGMLRSRVGPVLARRYELPPRETALARLGAVQGAAASWLPEASFLTVRDGTGRSHFSILRESAHTNVAYVFRDSARRVEREDALSVVPGFLSAYPNALFEVDRQDLESFVDAVVRLDGEAGYRALRLRFGVLRNSPSFWKHSDDINRANRELGPVDAGLLDYNHLEPW